MVKVVKTEGFWRTVLKTRMGQNDIEASRTETLCTRSANQQQARDLPEVGIPGRQDGG